mgnify:CR=1 FL=1|jgi:hypothetical protein
MEDLKIYMFTIMALLLMQIGFSQQNEQYIINSPTKELKVVLYSNGKPVVEGYVIAVDNKLINHGMFVIYKSNGVVKQTVHYNMGKIIKITNFSKEEKI